MIVAKWREGFDGLYKGIDANIVANEILSIGSSPTAKEIVDFARSSNTELHKCFEWDDSLAAEKYREKQARDVVHFLVIKEKQVPVDRPEVRFFVSTEKGKGYKQTKFVVQKQDEYQELLAQAWAELKAFKEKYKMITELQEIFKLIK